MNWWVYKCNNEGHPYPNHYSDWGMFFNSNPLRGRWGLVSVVSSLAQLRPGDMVLAYQADRNELYGLVRMTRLVGDEVHFEPVERLGVRVRALKRANPTLNNIPAFSRGPKQTLVAISMQDADRMIRAARESLAERVGG